MMAEEPIIAIEIAITKEPIIAITETAKFVIPKRKIVTMVEMSKCVAKSATARKMRCHAHAAVSSPVAARSSHASPHMSSSHMISGRGLYRGRQ
jgi:hypothetical protein